MKKLILSAMAICFTSAAGAASLTIAEKLQDIMNSKEQIRQAIEAQGVQVPSNTPLSQYADKIGQITVKNSCSTCHQSLQGVCSDPTDTSHFPYAKCGDKNYTTGQSATFQGTSCPLASGSGTIYGKSLCSSQSGVYGVGIVGTPSSVSGEYGWCQLCTDSSRTLCGAWVYNLHYNASGLCSSYCANHCGDNISNSGDGNLKFRLALCAAP